MSERINVNLSSDQPHVIILMAVYNGARHLSEQLDSLIAQSHKNWSLIASDDGSTDTSRKILHDYAARGYAISVIEGPRLGAAENFMSLLRCVGSQLDGERYVALCDQDDVWLPHRLSNGVERLADVGAEPGMVFSDLLVTDENLQNPRSYARRSRPPAFRNALVQNIASGNATLLNPAAAKIVSCAAFEAGRVVVHDWWLYQIVTGVGGAAIYDNRAGLYYRQHGNNQIGSNHGLRAKVSRIAMVGRGRYGVWNGVNLAALKRSAEHFTPENRDVLAQFEQLQSKRLQQRLLALFRGGFYRQSAFDNILLWIAGVFGKL